MAVEFESVTVANQQENEGPTGRYLQIVGEDFHPPRLPLLLNEFGIVVPPPISSCIGERCKHRGSEPVCELTRHHNQSTAPLYEGHSELAENFRLLPSLTVWIPKCQHEIHHGRHALEAPIPDDEVMQQAISEDHKIRRLQSNLREINAISRLLDTSSYTLKGKKSLNRQRSNLLRGREGMLDEVDEVKVIPESLVTGALILAAPNLARSRMYMGGDFVITGTVPKELVPQVLEIGDEMLADAVEHGLQSGVDRVQSIR